jgi:hypothetical protein
MTHARPRRTSQSDQRTTPRPGQPTSRSGWPAELNPQREVVGDPPRQLQPAGGWDEPIGKVEHPRILVLDRLTVVGGGAEQVLAGVLLADPGAVDAGPGAQPLGDDRRAGGEAQQQRRGQERQRGGAGAATSPPGRRPPPRPPRAGGPGRRPSRRRGHPRAGRRPAGAGRGRGRRPWGRPGNRPHLPYRPRAGRAVRSLPSASSAGGPVAAVREEMSGSECRVTEPPTGSDTIGTDHSNHFALSAPASSNLRPSDYESLPRRLWRLAQCRPPRSDPVCRPADTVPSCGVARGGMTNRMTVGAAFGHGQHPTTGGTHGASHRHRRHVLSRPRYRI